MPVIRATLFVLAIFFGSWSTALASPTSIVDTTAGTATSDGAVLPGEYVGSSVGINAGFGDVIGIGSRIHLDSDAAGDMNLGIVSGGSPLNDAIVVYIDSVAGGAASTANLIDASDSGRAAASATNGVDSAPLSFAPGFGADYALVIEPTSATLFALVELGSHIFVRSLGQTVTGPGSLQRELDGWAVADLGLSAGDSFDYVVTLINGATAFRSNEFQGVAASTVAGGNPGLSPVVLASGDANRFTTYSAAPPVPVTSPLMGLVLAVGLGWAGGRSLSSRRCPAGG